jgi:GH15 family glucan-1,4-alpha-glucosidase
MKLDYDRFIDDHLAIIRRLLSTKGLFLAAAEEGVSTGYDKAWLRDNFYTSLAFEYTGEMDIVRGVWHAILDIFLQHEDKISWAAKNKPYYAWQYIHARYHPENFSEFWEEWGNKQNDAVGCILFKICELEKNGANIIRDDNDRRILQKLIDYLASIEYWRDPDNGVWEEYEEVHASSIGPCIAGLISAKSIGFTVADDLITLGKDALIALLPRESKTKFTDLALLSLIWPYCLLEDLSAAEVVSNLEYHLERDKGVIRYKNDRYYNRNEDGTSEEAEWTMGFPWLSIIYAERGEFDKAEEYFIKACQTLDSEGKLPELYYSHTNEPNENNPLGWAESLLVVSAIKLRSRA